MKEYSVQNQTAWEYNAYEFWVKDSGTPAQLAESIRKNPVAKLKRYSAYLEKYEGVSIANICGSCGKKAVPLALLGADVTIFDISEENCRYAMELAQAAGVSIGYEVGDVLEIGLSKYGSSFDVIFFEGGVLHYFHEIDEFMKMMWALLKPGGRIICSDFHPLTKVMDVLNFQLSVKGYFSTEIYEGEMAHARFFPDNVRASMPKCSYRKYTLSEIINSMIGAGFRLDRFDEHPAWTNPNLPGEFTIIAHK